MNKGPFRSNGLLDIILNGLKLTGDLDDTNLGALSLVSKLYNTRLKKDFIREQTFSDEDKQVLGISAKELLQIKQVVSELGCELPASQPRDSQEWEYYTSVPKDIKKSLIALYPIVGPNLLDYVRVLAPYTDQIRSLMYWLNALQELYQSGNEEADLFHGLFLNNHNFAKRAYDLALRTEINFSTNVLGALADCRFSSLTMNSLELTKLFTELGDFYHTLQTSKKQQYGRAFEEVSFFIETDEIKTFIKEKYIPKTLLWRSKKTELTTTPASSLSLPLPVENDLPSQDSSKCSSPLL